jgi:hypothetical protein
MIKTMLKNIHKKLNLFLLKHGLVKIDVEPTSELLKIIKKVYGLQFKLYSNDGQIAIGVFKENNIIGTNLHIYSEIPNSYIDIRPAIIFQPLRSNMYSLYNEYTTYDIEKMLDDIESSIRFNSYNDSHDYYTKNELTSFSIPSGKSENEIIMKIKLSN